MRKVLLLLVVLSACTHQPSAEEKFKTDISTFVKNRCNDAESYEAVEYGKLDSQYYMYDQTPEGKKELLRSDSIDKIFDKPIEKAKDDYDVMLQIKLERQKKEAWKALDLSAKGDEYLKHRKWDGTWKITHLFRTKNEYGAKAVNTAVILLDKNKKPVEMVIAESK
ncbi:MAG: hypothetical protein NTX03_02655 [Bacteroidetes bacterium]|nr:hypothetical protein [Bacteroidota bacterium]